MQGRPATTPGGTVVSVDLEARECDWQFVAGTTSRAWGYDGQVPGPVLEADVGDVLEVRLKNSLPEPTTIHWHGLRLPAPMDGTDMVQHPIAPGETFTYRFPLRQSGSYWYHSHSGFQEMTGMYGALIVQPRDGERLHAGRIRADREHVILLSDWTDEHPMRVLAKLKMQSDLYNGRQPTVADFFRDVSAAGLGSALNRRRMWQQMRMNPTDLADLSSATLTCLMNGMTPAKICSSVTCGGATPFR